MNKFCSNLSLLEMLEFFGIILKFFLMIIPLIIIIYGTFDFFKLLITDEKKNIKLFLKRVISGMLMFFLIPFARFIFFDFGEVDNNCFKVFLGEKRVDNINKMESINSEKECKKLQAPYVWLDGSCRIDISTEDIDD